jgi:hypothetical protein
MLGHEALLDACLNDLRYDRQCNDWRVAGWHRSGGKPVSGGMVVRPDFLGVGQQFSTKRIWSLARMLAPQSRCKHGTHN